MTFDRRRFIALTGGAGALAAGLGARPALAAETLTGVNYLPASYKALSYGSNGFVERLREVAPEGLTVDFFDSAKLLTADEQLPALRSGTIDFMFHTTGEALRPRRFVITGRVVGAGRRS